MKRPAKGGSGKASRSPLTAPEFQAITGVDDAVLERLRRFVETLEKWQPKINLVGAASLADVWRRHLLDSAQLHALMPPAAATVLDLGSGAGFPGMVLAIIGGVRVHLVDSDARKCAFLGEVKRITKADCVIHNRRIEALRPFAADVVTGRALAPLERLLGYAFPFLGEGAICLFPKGEKVDRELTDSEKKWTMRVTQIRSLSDPSGTILKVEAVCPRHGP